MGILPLQSAASLPTLLAGSATLHPGPSKRPSFFKKPHPRRSCPETKGCFLRGLAALRSCTAPLFFVNLSPSSFQTSVSLPFEDILVFSCHSPLCLQVPASLLSCPVLEPSCHIAHFSVFPRVCRAKQSTSSGYFWSHPYCSSPPTTSSVAV